MSIYSLVEELIEATRAVCHAPETELTEPCARMEAARVAIVEAFPHWIPLSEQRPPEDVTRYTARVVNGVSYWAALPEFPQPPEVRIAVQPDTDGGAGG
jgi:hypothetical protein